MIFQGGFCKEPLVLFGKAYLLPSTINCPGDVRHLNERTYFFLLSFCGIISLQAICFNQNI